MSNGSKAAALLVVLFVVVGLAMRNRSQQELRAAHEARWRAERQRDAAVAAERPERSGSAPAARRADANSLLEEENARLQTEIERLRGELAAARDEARAGDPRRRQLADHFAANELVHAILWRDLAEVLLDGEQVAEDPTQLFAPLLALIDATGLANAPWIEGARQIGPEPGAPESRLRIACATWSDKVVRGSSESTRECESIEVTATLQLANSAPGWNGGPLAGVVTMQLLNCSDGRFEFLCEAHGFDARGDGEVLFELSIDRDDSHVVRQPRRGGSDQHDLAPGEFAELRRALDELFRKLRTVAG